MGSQNSHALRRRPSAAMLTAKLKKRMKSGCNNNEGRNSFAVDGLAALLAYAAELALKYLPDREVIEGVVRGYAMLYAEKSTQLFLDAYDGDFLADAFKTTWAMCLV